MDKTAPAADEPEFTYRPLVAKGEDRAARLAEVIERWATETPSWLNLDGDLPGFPDLDSIRQSNAALVGVDLRDDNENAAAIDLAADLLKPLAIRLGAECPGEITKPCAVVAIFDCRIRSLHAELLFAPFHLILVGARTTIREANFYSATVLGAAYFDEASFTGHASFHKATFNDFVSFENAHFDGDVYLSDIHCKGSVSFHSSTCIGSFDFRPAAATSSWRFYNADLRRGVIAYTPIPLLKPEPVVSLFHGLTDSINWQWVRNFGQLTAFTRVSYIALAGVPLLAGLWVPLRRGIAMANGALEEANAKLDAVVQQLESHPGIEFPPEMLLSLRRLLSGTLPETMPISWLLAFLAAFAVVIARLVYQLRAPELIREASEDEWVERANERNRVDGGITDERLREAIGYLHEAAERLPHRHSAWFVRRHKRTVWIPDNLAHFESALIDEPKPKLVHFGWVPGKIDAKDQEVQPEDRKRIAIEDGQRARYAVAAFENRVAAWISGGFYVLAIWLLLMIVFRQLAYVAEASAAPRALSSLFYTLSWGPWVGFGAEVILAITALGAIVVDDPRWWDWGASWLSWLGSWRGRGAKKTER